MMKMSTGAGAGAGAGAEFAAVCAAIQYAAACARGDVKCDVHVPVSPQLLNVWQQRRDLLYDTLVLDFGVSVAPAVACVCAWGDLAPEERAFARDAFTQLSLAKTASNTHNYTHLPWWEAFFF